MPPRLFTTLAFLSLGPLLVPLLPSGSPLCAAASSTPAVPLPEHPRPDFERAEWQNLNGYWAFRFDKEDAGENERWFDVTTQFPLKITVPFPWGSKLSGVENVADVAWYRRTVKVPGAWRNKRVFLVIGACDWLTRAWLDGQLLGEHRGGYTPFEFELTSRVRWDEEQSLVLRVDDTPHRFKLDGKQGYGPAKGIWQTVYLEARPQTFIDTIHFLPDVDRNKVTVMASLSEPAPANAQLRLQFKSGSLPQTTHSVPKGAKDVRFDVPIPQPHLWSLEDPFLYELDAVLRTGEIEDRVSAYFGLRKISVMNLPGTEFPYIALNNKPIYLQMTLDQSYHPDGFYTYPSDAFMRDEVLRSRRLGLNANRLHVKIDVPRKLYWADRLGLLLMCDIPNSWGEPTPDMRREIESALRSMIRRDFNHPAIFSWVLFNETWGLFTKQNAKNVYLPETQNWVASLYRLAKGLDPSRLIEDNSPCNNDHVETDINSWHAYLPGYAWRDMLDQVSRDTFSGSTWNFIGSRSQARQPLLNSECGNVWGYEGSTGDVDWSWDYHIMINEFRRHPKICGWLYTEHHDVINEWNGYYRYDRSDKFTGMDELVPGMSLRDLHGPFYLSTGSELCRDVRPEQKVKVPLYASFLAENAPDTKLIVRSELHGWDTFGHKRSFVRGAAEIPFAPWTAIELPALNITMPPIPALAILQLTLETKGGTVLHRNFTAFLVTNGTTPRSELVKTDAGPVHVVRFAPDSFSDAKWSLKQWNVLRGLKVNGAGHGYFEYRISWPGELPPKKVAGASLILETSAKQLLGKDRDGAAKQEGDFMLGKGTHDPSLNPNSYPMTDTVPFPSAVRVLVNRHSCGTFDLPDDPADHRGILSWHAQKRDKKLREAGSYGYLITATIPQAALQTAAQTKEIVVRLEVDNALPGGLAIYGERFGRYPLDPTLVFTLR
jgi:hypothetical protein